MVLLHSDCGSSSAEIEADKAKVNLEAPGDGTLTRIIDGVTGARFLSAFKGFIEQPLTMIL